MIINCPVCGKDDSVLKVPEIISGTPAQTPVDGHTLYATGDQAGMIPAALLQKLTLPGKKDWDGLRDKWNRKPGENPILQDYLATHVAPGPEPGPIFRRFLYLMGGICLLLAPFVWIFGTGLATSFFLIAGIVILLIERLIYLSLSTPEYREWDKQRARFSQQIIPALKRRVEENIKRVYYCHRDQLVFIPETNFKYDTAAAGDMGFWVALGRI
jgi:hypothetical protein